MRKLVIGLGSLVAVGILGVAGMVGFTLHKTNSAFNNAQAEHQATIEKYREQYVADQKAIQASGLLDFDAQGQNAAEFLNRKISWNTKSESSMFRLPQNVADILNQRNSDWRKNLAGVDLEAIDTSALTKLLKYSHWDLTENSPISDLRKTQPFAPMSTYPFPEFSELRNFAKVRLAQGERRKDIATAAREVRHLAKLVYSTESLVGSMVAVALFRDAGDVPEETLSQMKRALWASTGLVSQLSSNQQLEDLVSGKLGQYGVCSALFENGDISNRYRIVFEAARGKEYFDLVGRLLDTHPECRLRPLRQAWGDPTNSRIPSSAPNNEIFVGSGVETTTEWSLFNVFLARFLPASMFREVTGKLLITIGNPDYWKLYASR